MAESCVSIVHSLQVIYDKPTVSLYKINNGNSDAYIKDIMLAAWAKF
jgi:hypothetical protein